MNALSRLYDGIRRLGPERVIRVIVLGSLAVMASFQASARGDDIEARIEQSQAGGAARELLTRAITQPRKTDEKHELAILDHKRGMANYRLGNYSRALDGLRLGVEYN